MNTAGQLWGSSASAPASWDSFSGLNLQELLLPNAQLQQQLQKQQLQQQLLAHAGPHSQDSIHDLLDWRPSNLCGLDLELEASQLLESLPSSLLNAPQYQGSDSQVQMQSMPNLPNFGANPQSQQSMQPLSSDAVSGSFFPTSGLLSYTSALPGQRVVAVQGEIVSPATVLVDLDTGRSTYVQQQNVGVDMASFQPQAMVPNVRMGRSRGRGRKSSTSAGQRYPQQQIHLPGLMNGSVRAAAPSWAGADWNPLRVVQQVAPPGNGNVPTAGTGVFLPSGTGVFLPKQQHGARAAASSPAAAPPAAGSAHPSPGPGAAHAPPGGSVLSPAGSSSSSLGKGSASSSASVATPVSSSDSMTDAFPVASLIAQGNN